MAPVNHHGCLKCFAGRLHEVAATAAVHVHVYAAGQNVAAPGIDARTGIFQHAAVTVYLGDFVVVNHHRAAVYPAAPGN